MRSHRLGPVLLGLAQKLSAMWVIRRHLRGTIWPVVDRTITLHNYGRLIETDRASDIEFLPLHLRGRRNAHTQTMVISTAGRIVFFRRDDGWRSRHAMSRTSVGRLTRNCSVFGGRRFRLENLNV